jgi:ABC-type nitrate/sulfonate/bicarbonate transport system ATPase subunit
MSSGKVVGLRIFVLRSRPGIIQKEIPVDPPRPRDLDLPETGKVCDEIFHTIGVRLKVEAG